MSAPDIQANIIQRLKTAQHVVIASHQKPDGDAVGSSLALAHIRANLGKPYTLYNVDIVGSYLRFLPKAQEIGPHNEVWQEQHFDVLVVLDSGDLKHAGIADHVAQLPSHVTVINIDHHATNQQYGHLNLVLPTASSTCEIVYHLLNHYRLVTKDIATCLLTGLITDTGSFSNLATTASAVQTASELLARGANLSSISKTVLNNRPYTTLKLWGRALERLYEDPTTNMVVTVLTLEDMTELGADDEAASGISNLLNSLDQAADKAILVLTQTKPGIIKGSLRTTNPLLDVSEFAKLHGGGGHKKAAGFTLKGTLKYTPNGYVILNSNSH